MIYNTGQRNVILGIFITVMVVFIARLFYIQVIDDEYMASANNNVLRYVTIYPPRGVIYDREGRVMVHNEVFYDLTVVPRQVKEIDTNEFCSLLMMDKEEFRKRMVAARQYSSYKASLFEKQISKVNFATLQEKLYKFPGFFVQPRTLRYYPRPVAAHLLGYVGEVDERIISKKPYYKSGDYIGISGLESSYEEALRGKKGLKVVMVDVHNREKGSFKNGAYDSTSYAGENLILSLDLELQEYAEKLMANKLGGVVAIEPGTGEILAIVSAPAYDPNLLVGRVRANNYRYLLNSPLKPLFNRSTQAYYPPGSTFKLINGLIACDKGLMTSDTRHPCAFSVGSHHVKCHGSHSGADLRRAIQFSCNPYFCRVFTNYVGNDVFSSTEEGYNNWRDAVLSFGVGKKLGSDIPHELAGLVPTSAYYDKYFGKGKWKPNTIFSLGIGQGELGITPLQMANIMCIIANKGYYYVPHVVKYIGKNKNVPAEFTKKRYCSVSPEHFVAVQDGMQLVVEAGTARVARMDSIVVCGKTGTAQNPHGKDHALFYAFAPRDNPKIAIAVIVENSGFGGTWAAPIASLLLEKYLNDSIARPELEKKMLNAVILPQPKDASDSTSVND